MELYAAMVEHMDANIGKLTSYLKDKNLYDNTLIIFLSDNGPEGNTMKMDAPWDNSNFDNWGKKGTFIQYGAAWAQVECRALSHVQRLSVRRRHSKPTHHRWTGGQGKRPHLECRHAHHGCSSNDPEGRECVLSESL